MLDHPFLTVLIPVYNEEKNILPTLKAISQKLTDLGTSFEALVVDDGSHDRTVDLLEEEIKQRPYLRLARHEKNRGPGSGIVTGIEHSHGKFIIFIPADLAMNIEHLERYLNASKEADVVVGLRSDRRDYSFFRKCVSQLNIFLIRSLFAMPYRQFNYISMYRTEIFRHITLSSRSVFITAEIMIKARDAGFRLTEIEVGYVPRTFGRASGASLKSILKTTRDLFYVWYSWVWSRV